jgi:hypothetical protein
MLVFDLIKNAAKVVHHILPCEKCAEYGQNVAKSGDLGRNPGFFGAKTLK